MQTNYELIEEQLESLKDQKLIFHWKEMSPGQYRINDVLDLYPAHHKWHSLPSSKRGKYYDLVDFVGGFFNPELRKK